MTQTSLVRRMQDLPRMGLSTRAKQDAAMRYTLRLCNAAGFNNVLRPFTDAATVRKCRMGLSNMSWFPLNFRLAAYHYAVNNSDSKLQSACDQLEILDEDRSLIRRFIHEHRPIILRRAKSMYGDKIPHPETVRRRCGEALTEIRKATEGIVNRRLRFVEVFNGVSREDLLGEVQARQVQQFYWSYTRDVDAGASPWLVTVATNTCRNLATRYSAKCRKTSTDRDASGISQLLVVSNMARTSDKSEVNLYDKAIDTSPSAESKVAAEHILGVLDGLARTPRQRRFFEILVSDHDDEFDTWLLTRGLIRSHQTHADFRSKHGLEAFLDKVSEMLCVSPHKPRLLLKEARKLLTSQGYE